MQGAIAPWGTRDITRPFVWVNYPRARGERSNHMTLSLLNGLLLLSTCTSVGSRCGGLHIKQTEAFDVDGNTNTDLSRVVTAYLFPLVIH